MENWSVTPLRRVTSRSQRKRLFSYHKTRDEWGTKGNACQAINEIPDDLKISSELISC